MKKIPLLLATAAFALFCDSARATTVIPPTFDELVGRAQMIFEGTVTDVRSNWTGEGAERHIESLVTFKVKDSVKGNASGKVTLSMMGGTVGDQTLEVTDAPKFKVGDHDILFVENNGTQFIPLVGIMHGRFRVQSDSSGGEVVMTNEGVPLSDVSKLGKDETGVSSGRALSLASFKQVVRSTAASLAAHPPQ